MKTFAEAEIALVASLPNYESRQQQQALARAVEATFANPNNFSSDEESDEEPVESTRRHLIAQAGCGVGKSLGYLIPAILSGKRVAVSVTTKALQEQLAGKDLPFLQEHLGVKFKWAVLKGRSNYLCVAHAIAASDVPNLDKILKKAEEPGFSGLREDFGFDIPASVWVKLASETDECQDYGCKDRGDCFALRARKYASDAKVVIVNHALLFTDLIAGNALIGPYDLVVFDEAHEIEDVASGVVGIRFSLGTIRGLASNTRSWAAQNTDSIDKVSEAGADLTYAATELFKKLPSGRIRFETIFKFEDEFVAVNEALINLRDSFAALRSETASDMANKRRKTVSRSLGNALRNLQSIILDDFSETVRWVEEETAKNGERRKIINASPIDIGPFLRKELFSKIPAILCSATLAVNGKFDYISGRLGIDEFDCIDVGTPFDFQHQARLYIASNLPAPKGDSVAAWESLADGEIIRLIKASEGRALVLFTSVKHMKQSYANVSRALQFPIKMQGQETTKSLADWFTTTNEGVLFGTKSFFTGFDVQGDSLSLVIVSKMPTPVPTEPMIEARCESINARGGRAFTDYVQPVTSLVLQQAVGRLIRHRNDRGVVAILDPRLVTMGYGQSIARDLPPMPRVSIDGVEEFFDSLKVQVSA